MAGRYAPASAITFGCPFLADPGADVGYAGALAVGYDDPTADAACQPADARPLDNWAVHTTAAEGDTYRKTGTDTTGTCNVYALRRFHSATSSYDAAPLAHVYAVGRRQQAGDHDVVHLLHRGGRRAADVRRRGGR